jgi:choline-sulfatase
LFGLATGAAGKPQHRDGVDVLAALEQNGATRDIVMSYHETPGSPYFKMMVRSSKWKYIFMANGGREQLFDVESDPHESKNLASSQSSIARKLRTQAVAAIDGPHRKEALAQGDLRAFPFTPRPRNRIYQFDHSRGVTGFPKSPKEELAKWRRA